MTNVFTEPPPPGAASWGGHMPSQSYRCGKCKHDHFRVQTASADTCGLVRIVCIECGREARNRSMVLAFVEIGKAP